ncbi:MAG: ferrous iron transport protein A [Hungatella sp.]|nr:ferrous iron transport protein A [Hungatella sp.]
MTMDELKPKQSAFIRSVGGTGALRHHLLDMGLTPKTEVTLQKIAPMGDPVQIELRGYELTLRLDEAQKITVEKVHTKAEKNHATQRTMAVEHPGVGELGRANSCHVLKLRWTFMRKSPMQRNLKSPRCAYPFKIV